MAAQNNIAIQNNKNRKIAYLRCVESYEPSKNQPAIAIPLINTGASNAVLFRFSGQVEEVNLSFAIFDDDTDISGGTHSSTVKTVAEQIQYLKDDIFTEEYDTDWSLWDTIDLVYAGGNNAIKGVIENIRFNIKQGANTVVTASLTFKRGNIGNL